MAWPDNVSFAVIASAGITAAVQADAALVGSLIARMPSPFFFTLVTFFSSPLVMVLFSSHARLPRAARAMQLCDQ